MGSSAARAVVLLPIRPQYATPIMEGKKCVEFRRRSFKQDVSHVVVYSSSPIKKIIGFFEVEDIEEAAPTHLWRKYEHVGAITAAAYRDYFTDALTGFAIKVGAVHQLKRPIALTRVVRSARPPQSFMYLDGSVIAKLRDDKPR